MALSQVSEISRNLLNLEENANPYYQTTVLIKKMALQFVPKTQRKGILFEAILLLYKIYLP